MLQLVLISSKGVPRLCRRPLMVLSMDGQMSYEPGTTECRVLINSKDAVETMLLNLGRLQGAERIVQQLRQVHQQLEELHDQRRQQVEAVHSSAS